MRFYRPLFGVLALCAACTDADTSLEPANGRRLWASTHGELIATDGDRGTLTVTRPALDRVDEVPVGDRPGQIVEVDGELWVSVRGERRVVSLTRRLEAWVVDREVAVGAEPMGLAVDRARHRLYVACTQADSVSVVDLTAGEVVRTVPVAGGPRSVVVHPSGRVFVATERDGRLLVLDPDALAPQVVPLPAGRRAMSTIELDLRITGDLALSPEASVLEVPGVYLDTETPFDPPVTGTAKYYKGKESGYHFNPVVIDVPITDEGQPQQDDITVTTLFEDTGEGSMPTSIAYAGDRMYVALESRGEVLELDATPTRRLVAGKIAIVHHDTAGLAEGIVVDRDGATFVSSRLSRTIARLDGAATVEQPKSPLGWEVERGRLLFFSSTESGMSADGITCGNCHYDGRTDGLSWTFPYGPRQTPSLAERVTERTPLRWGGDRATVAEDAALTAPLMGGLGLTTADAQAVEAFVRALPTPDLPRRGAVDEAVTRGQAVFAQAGCVSCHAGELLTDSRRHALTGRAEVVTPSLLGVSATPPYMYDGSLPTLRDVVARAAELGHSTVPLSAEEVEQVVAYLTTR